jgi:hypothetical protein
MAKHDTDPVLAQLIEAVNESAQAAVPVTVSTGGMLLTGLLIAQDAYFAELAESSPLLSALQPATGLLGKEYAREVAAGAGHHLHLRGGRAGDEEITRWRISLHAVDAWSLRAPAPRAGEDDKGPFARLLGV